MWWTFFILFLFVSIFSSISLYYALRRINQYENLITQIQQIIEYSTERMKIVDSKGAGVLECPITGGEHRAKSGNISILAAGTKSTFKRCFSILALLGYEI